MSNFLKSMIKTTGNSMASLVSDGNENDTTSFINTGSMVFNALISGSLYGGMPDNKILALAGESGVGKTFFALNFVFSFLKEKKDGVVMYFDTEGAVSSEMIVERGIPTNRIAIVPLSTVEQFRKQAFDIVDAYLKLPIEDRKPLMLVLDSLGLLASEKEVSDVAEGKEVADMTRAKKIRSLFRILTLKLAQAKIPLIITNHTYQTLSLYSTKVMNGGEGLRFSASTIVFLSKKKEKDSNNNVVGNVIHCTTYKSRFTKENQQVDTLLMFDNGLSKYYGLLEIAEKYEIFKKVSTRYELPDGSKVFGKEINENPEKYFTPEVMQKLELAVKKEFCYGQGDLKSQQVKNTEIKEE